MAQIFIRRGVFYCRLPIPATIRATVNGRSDLWKSLRTRSRDIATPQAARWEGRVNRLFFRLAQSSHTMTPAQISALVADSERDATSLAITDQLEDSTSELLNNDFHRVAATANDLLTKHGVTVERDSLDWKRLCRGLLVGLQTALQTELRNVEGDFSLHSHRNSADGLQGRLRH